MLSSKPKFIYFDLDDTLLDHKKAEVLSLTEIYNQFDFFKNISLETLSTVYNQINSALWEQYGNGVIDKKTLQRNRFENTCVELGLGGELHVPIGNAYLTCYEKHWEWIEDARKAYLKISDKFNVGILTNGFADIQKKKIKQFDLEETAKEIVISEEFGVLKPKKEIFDYSAQKAGVDADDILYIGDSLTSDVIGATNAGWRVAWYTNQPNEVGANRAEVVFNKFDKLLQLLDIND